MEPRIQSAQKAGRDGDVVAGGGSIDFDDGHDDLSYRGFRKDFSCRTGALRGRRPLRGVYTASRGAPDGRPEMMCRPTGGPPRRAYTNHEVIAPRVVGPSGRTRTYLLQALP
jgi:hypothetical protein